MRPHQLEVWVHDIVERVVARAPIEDTRVELKSTWPDASRAARRLAGHANAARGEPILWLIGVDEKAASVVGAEDLDPARWLPQVQAQFDLMYPELLLHLVIPVESRVAVVALQFDTRQAPYVVKNVAHGSSPDAVAWEVPWRDGARTRTARRSELLRILSPLQLLPDVEVMGAQLTVRRDTVKDETGAAQAVMQWNMSAAGYFAPPVGGEVVLPFHRCHVRVMFPGSQPILQFNKIHIGREMEFVPVIQSYPTVTFSPFVSQGSPAPRDPRPVPSEWILRSPSRLLLTGEVETEEIVLPEGDAELVARLGVVRAEQDLTVKWSLSRLNAEIHGYVGAWVTS